MKPVFEDFAQSFDFNRVHVAEQAMVDNRRSR